MYLTPIEIEALELSLKVSFWAVGCSLPVGIAVAWFLSRKSFPGRFLVDSIVHLPLILPPVAVGYMLLVVLGRHGPVGSWLWDAFEISISFSWKGAAVAAGVMGFPLMVRAIRLGIDAVDPKLEQAARTLGAPPISVFFTVTIPLILPSVMTGMLLAFARCIGEFGATITFVSNIPSETRTLPLALYTAVQSPGGEVPAIRLVVLSFVIALAALIASEYLSRKARR